MFNTPHTMFMAHCTNLGPRWTALPSASAIWAIPHPEDICIDLRTAEFP